MVASWQRHSRHTSNDRWHEQRNRVQRGVNANRDEHVYPDLPVFERMEHVFGVVLVRQRRAVLREAVRYFGLLL